MTRLIASLLAGIFSFVSGPLRNARTFHPDGRTFLATVSAETPDPTLSGAGKMLKGHALMRIGMGIVKKGAPAWLKKWLPDAPSIAVRFSPDADEISTFNRAEHELDVLFTAGGDRLWKLVGNLASGGRCFELNQFDYLQNRYFADVPYRIPDCGLDVWLRLTPEALGRHVDATEPKDAEAREQGLTEAATGGAVLLIEAQSTSEKSGSFFPLARIRFDREIEIDQEALRFQPVAGRGYEPYGVLTALREKVYPASAHARPADRAQREFRDRKGFVYRLFQRSDETSAHATDASSDRPLTIRRLACGLSLAFVAIVFSALALAAARFLPNYPLTNPPDSPDRNYSQKEIYEKRFKYGSTGGEANLGFPILMWEAAPLICPETLKKVVGKEIAADYVTRVRNYNAQPNGGPNETRLSLSREGYKAFGLIYEKEKTGEENDIPVGVSKRRNLGFDRVFVNCAFCHTGTVRTSVDSEPAVVLGMPANQLNIRNFEDFLFQCVGGPKFSKENLIPEIENMSGRLSLFDRYILYPAAIWIVRDRVGFLSSRLGFFVKQPDWGPGRVDTFSNAKGIFNWPWQKLPDWNSEHRVEPDQVGTVEFPSIWRQRARKKRADGCPMELHWDGNNDAVEERDLSAAFGTGALPPNIDHTNIGKIEAWLLDKSVPRKFTESFPEGIKTQLAEKGRGIYQQHCAACHGVDGQDFSGEKVGYVTPIGKIKTDRYRLDNYTEGLAAGQSMLYAGEKKTSTADAPPEKCDPPAHGDAQENSYRFKRFHKTYGYANTPLDGIWLRAPYLHNGSVPTLRDLLNPAASRPKSYFRGSDVYDPVAMGFESHRETRPDGRAYFLYDTTLPGNSNQGHEGPAYGTDLPEQDKTALIEFLKTF
jgi:hypothetical protein